MVNEPAPAVAIEPWGSDKLKGLDLEAGIDPALLRLYLLHDRDKDVCAKAACRWLGIPLAQVRRWITNRHTDMRVGDLHLDVIAQLKPTPGKEDKEAVRKFLELATGLAPGKIITGKVAIKHVATLRKAVERLRLSIPTRGMLDSRIADLVPRDAVIDPKPLLRPGPRPTKHRVYVGIIDDGCDFTNLAFADPAGGTRIEILWDQTEGLPQGKAPKRGVPPPYGRSFDKETLDAAIKAGVSGTPRESFWKLDYFPMPRAHGTHVLDIAAGAEGICPSARILFVQLPRDLIAKHGSLASSRHVIDAVDYIVKAADKLEQQVSGDEGAKARIVINLSIGNNAGPHDGTTLHELALDERIKMRKKNLAIVAAAGNERLAQCHARKTVKSGKTAQLRWAIAEADFSPNQMEIWYRPVSGSWGEGAERQSLVVQLVPPGEIGELENGDRGIRPDEGAWIKRGKRRIGDIFHRRRDRGNGDSQIFIVLNQTASRLHDAEGDEAISPPGIWTIEFQNPSADDIELHAWIERDPDDARHDSLQSRFVTEDADTGCTLSNFACAQHVIAVGACSLQGDTPLPFSGEGPLRTGDTSKPDLVAPSSVVQLDSGRSNASEADGAIHGGILAACALDPEPIRKSGTSMSAPIVTGLIARMFAVADLDLSIDDIRSALKPTGGSKQNDARRRRMGKGSVLSLANRFPGPRLKAQGGNPAPIAVTKTAR